MRPTAVRKSASRWIGVLLGHLIRSVTHLILKGVMPAAAALTQHRLRKGCPRSLWGVTPILTLPLKAQADRVLGIRSNSLVFTTYHIRRDFDFNLQRVAGAASKLGVQVRYAFDNLLLAWALCRYDVFHFFFDRGLTSPENRFGFRNCELDMFRAAGKRVYLYAYGADVRRRETTLALGRWNFCVECPSPGAYCVCDETIGVRDMAEMCARVTQPVALGDMLAYVPNARNFHYWPINLGSQPAVPLLHRATGPLKIVHAPNHTHFKGTHYLEAAIERLRVKGYQVDYVMVQGLPNTDVIRIFDDADVIADQFIGGAYGYTALEGMARGKPVLTYVRSPNLVEMPAECPLINTTPDTLDEVLLWLMTNRSRLSAIGAQGRAYVERRHSVSAVAARLAALYLDTANFPEALNERLRAFCRIEERRVASINTVDGWHHPWQV